MNQGFYNSQDGISNPQSFYNVIRGTGRHECPFWKSLGTPIPFVGDIKQGHTWYMRPLPNKGQANVHGEGAKRATITKWPTTALKNHLQIFKKTSGMSKSELASTTVEGKTKKLNTQKEWNRKQMKLDIESAAVSENAPTSDGVDADGNPKKTMGGAAHYAGLIIDCANTDVFDWDAHITEILKYQWKNGVTEDKHIMCGADVKQVINNYLNTGKRHTSGEKKVTQNVTHIEDSGWGTNIPITANANFDDNFIMIYAPELIHPVPLRAEKDSDCSDKTYDGVAYEDVIEHTLQVDDQNAVVIIKNIKLS